MLEYKMPKMDHTTEECSVAEWFVKEGDLVKSGDIVMSIESNKAVLDIEANFSGRVAKILIEPGEVVEVLSTIALIEEI